MKVPILFIIFNRPEIAANSFQSIRDYQPDVLYIAADGPRPSRQEEKELCNQTRQIILDMIDWVCDVKTFFREENIGVDLGVYGAINWLFSNEKWGVIIEDDCYVSQDFYHLCEDAFIRYENEPKVMHIIANNPMSTALESSVLQFTYYPMSWGWATWADKWHTIMDPEMKKYPDITIPAMIKRFGWFQGLMFYRSLLHTYPNRHILKPWDYIWRYSIMVNDGLCLIPDVNLAINRGIGTCEGSHYELGEKDYYEGLSMGTLKQPYRYPSELTIKAEMISRQRKEYFSLKMFGLRKKFRRFFHISR